ncbi:acyltransferase [Romboutsia lituseburensis]|uniref:acyltransferase n=1 Tax=Romboutsia lituseburensis TaxID=1537 RepID=UPI0022EA1B4B|nr:acyltransferase [Romboutsia lituseburensis]
MIKKIAVKVFSILKLMKYKLLFNKKINIKNLLKVRLGKNSKLIFENNKSNIVLGENISCRENVFFRMISGELIIGNNVFFNNFASINCSKKIQIGNDCLFGENVKIYDHDHIFNMKIPICKQGFKCKDIKIGNNVWIGSNCIILKGVNIGDNVVIGAGTVVRNDIPKDTIFYTDNIIIKEKIKYK